MMLCFHKFHLQTNIQFCVDIVYSWVSLTSCCLSCFMFFLKNEIPFNESTRSLKPYDGGNERRTN
jgi:hypothetical protein